jgi:predicted GTPase
MNAIEDQVRQWCNRLKHLRPAACSALGDEKLKSVVSGWVQLMAPLQIEEPQDQSRFIQLAVLLTPEQKESALVNGVVRRVLSNTDWEPKSRLDFVYKHLVGRPVSKPEEDFGRVFSGTVESR